MPGFNCLVDCVKKYKIKGIRKEPLPESVLVPWIEVKFAGGGQAITVGNRSYAPTNTAVIKSFQYGLSNGTGCNLEIFDEEGGQLAKFLQKITKGNRFLPNNLIEVRWGWANQNCGLGSTAPREDVSSSSHFLIPRDLVINFSAGGITFVIEATDSMQDFIQTVARRVYPNMRLVPAAQALVSDTSGGQVQVEFLDNSGTRAMRWRRTPADTDDGAIQGPLQRTPGWPANGNNPIRTLQNWCSKYLTEAGNGMTVFAADARKIVVMENPAPSGMMSQSDLERRHVGTYIVNGGACSTVLDWKPEIRWNYAMAAQNTGAFSGGNVRNDRGETPGAGAGPTSNPNLRDAGMNLTVSVSDYSIFSYWIDAGRRVVESAMAHMNANPWINRSIKAEMRIVGDPFLDDPIYLKGKFISVVVINPFHLRMSTVGGCGWVADPVCNPIMSNAGWMIEGVSHDIREGSYTTTLRLFLATPGIDVPWGVPLGANPTGAPVR